MELNKLYIYETAHGADSVNAHLEELNRWDISPEFVGLEIPIDDETPGVRFIAKKSPALAGVLYISVKIQKWVQNRGESNASRNDAEYEAGRQFADTNAIPVENVDRSRSKTYSEYLTLRRRVWDAVLFLCGVVIFAFAVTILLATAVGIYNATLSISTIVNGIAWVVVSGVLGLFSLSFLGRIGSDFLNGIRDARDEMMFATTIEHCKQRGCESALIIAGKRHSSGIAEYAEEHGVDCHIRSAPSIKNIEGDSFGLGQMKSAYLDD